VGWIGRLTAELAFFDLALRLNRLRALGPPDRWSGGPDVAKAITVYAQADKDIVSLAAPDQLFDDRRILVAPRIPLTQPHWRDGLSINEFFDQVLVINLDRRTDRWERVQQQFQKIDAVIQRIRAVDGRDPAVKAAFDLYLASGLIGPRSGGVRQVRSSREFYLDYDSEMARVAFEETRDGKKAIKSAGAWAYLKTWEGILEDAIKNRVPRTIVFDDDVLLHRDAYELFVLSSSQLPPDWLIFQLGTFQYDWGPEWVKWSRRNLYATTGAAIGSHAVGFCLEIAPFLLEHVKRMQLPFDVGALAMATRHFSERCFVAYPNIAIQAVDDPSDIGTSEFQKQTNLDEAMRRYRWNLPDYQ
jgi:GR25 family glycosyltransferase involved in LPS biosynthesis